MRDLSIATFPQVWVALAQLLYRGFIRWLFASSQLTGCAGAVAMSERERMKVWRSEGLAQLLHRGVIR